MLLLDEILANMHNKLPEVDASNENIRDPATFFKEAAPELDIFEGHRKIAQEAMGLPVENQVQLQETNQDLRQEVLAFCDELLANGLQKQAAFIAEAFGSQPLPVVQWGQNNGQKKPQQTTAPKSWGFPALGPDVNMPAKANSQDAFNAYFAALQAIQAQGYSLSREARSYLELLMDNSKDQNQFMIFAQSTEDRKRMMFYARELDQFGYNIAPLLTKVFKAIPVGQNLKPGNANGVQAPGMQNIPQQNLSSSQPASGDLNPNNINKGPPSGLPATNKNTNNLPTQKIDTNVQTSPNLTGKGPPAAMNFDPYFNAFKQAINMVRTTNPIKAELLGKLSNSGRAYANIRKDPNGILSQAKKLDAIAGNNEIEKAYNSLIAIMKTK